MALLDSSQDYKIFGTNPRDKSVTVDGLGARFTVVDHRVGTHQLDNGSIKRIYEDSWLINVIVTMWTISQGNSFDGLRIITAIQPPTRWL